MPADREQFSSWLFGSDRNRRYTQDSPILPDVWLRYAENPDADLDLLLTPHALSSSADLARTLHGVLSRDAQEAGLAYNESYVVVRLPLERLVREVLPLSSWWRNKVWPSDADDLGKWVRENRENLESLSGPDAEALRSELSGGELAWLIGLMGRIMQKDDAANAGTPVMVAAGLLDGMPPPKELSPPPLWLVNRNRPAQTTLWRSREAVKADAATLLFDISCSRLRWAIIDNGVDATHPAFRRRDEDETPADAPFEGEPGKLGTRVVASYDFTRMRELVSGNFPAEDEIPDEIDQHDLDQVTSRLQHGRFIDWDVLEPLLRIPHTPDQYRPPAHEHGTHVAGIVGADWRLSDGEIPTQHDVRGVCPDIELYDLRVFDERGVGDEFSILAALQFVRHLNGHSDLQVIHGANLSLSLRHEVDSYACGRTPICDECERLTANRVCVVTVAGNEGRAKYTTAAGQTEGYRTVSITDPGNAEAVITVGATHRHQAHTYGVSYFSSRGPTGDGRPKPDLVAPGEKIHAPVPTADVKRKDGTSQAAPHVSGAAALLMARHEELIGQPLRIKRILCDTATDLGRERHFQGAGMLDALRALESV